MREARLDAALSSAEAPSVCGSPSISPIPRRARSKLLHDGEHEHNLLQQEHGDADEDDEAVLGRDRERYLRVHTYMYGWWRAVGGRPVRCVAGMRPSPRQSPP